MNSQKFKSESATGKQPDYIKKQKQLKAMNKPFVPNKSINADAMIENLLSNKDTFQKKKDNPVNLPLLPPWLTPDSSTVSPFYSQLWSLVRMSTGQLADTSAVSSLLMTSGLSTDTLGFIWSLANKTVPGCLTQSELYAVLALVAVAQGGYIFNDTSILNQIPQPPIPKLDLTILPQYNMNFASHPGGVSTNYLQPNPVAIDSTPTHPGGVSAHYLQPNPAAIDSTVDNPKQPISIVSLDVNKLQGAPVLTLPNYNFGPYQGFDTAGAVIKNSTPSTSTYQEPSVSAIPSISLGLSTPTKVNHSFQKSNEISVLDRDLSSESSEVIAFNNINKFKLDSPTKLPSLSQPAVEVTKSLTKLSLKSEEKVKKREKVGEKRAGNIDDSFDSLSTERASVNPPKPNYNLDLFELTDEVQHVFPNSEPSLKGSSLSETTDKQEDCDFDDEFTDFQSADFTTCNTATNKHVQKPLPVDDLLSSPASINQPELNLKSIVGQDNFSPIIPPELSLGSRIEPEFNNLSTMGTNLTSELKSTLGFEATGLTNPSTAFQHELNSLSSLDLNLTMEPELKSRFDTGLTNLSMGVGSELNYKQKIEPGLSLTTDNTQNESNFSKNPVDNCEEDDDFTNFQAAPSVISEEELFPKTVTINAPNGTKHVDNSFCEKSETNVSEWSDNTSNDWTAGSGGNRSDTERDGDSLNYVDLSDIKLDIIPCSDTEEVVGIRKESDKERSSDKEDKYSALRGLEPEDVVANDEFGDFLAAEPGAEYHIKEMEGNNSAVQIRCLEACLQILQESYSILSSASSPQVLSEVMSDPRTTNHLTCLLEVFRVSERLIKHVENNDLVNQIQSTWNDILPLLEGSKCYQLEDTTGPVCELCRCDCGPFPMKYGRSTFHAPCVNLYLHYVDSNLPDSEAY